MLTVIVAILCLLLASLGVVLRKAYNIAPAHELRRQADAGNQMARELQPAIAYGASLRALLWLVIIIGSAVGFVLLATQLQAGLAIVIVGLIAWLNFVWLPKLRLGHQSLQITRKLTPGVLWLLKYIDKPLRLLAKATGRFHARPHSGLYELQDMLNLLDLQSQQPDSRITSEEIDLIRRVIGFTDSAVANNMRPFTKVTSVALTDAIGPVLLDELHASGQTIFPVRRSARSKEIVGSLQLEDIGIHSKGIVQDHAVQQVTSVTLTDSLASALHGFYKTKQQLFVVHDADDRAVGIITLQDILQSLIGRP